LDKAIQAIITYGNELSTSGEKEKGNVLVGLGQDIQTRTKTFKESLTAKNLSPEQTIKQFTDYQSAVLNRINQSEREYSKFRASGASWQSIVINIVMALSGIGALILAGKLIHSKATTGNARFFSTKDFTEGPATSTSEDKVNQLKDRLKSPFTPKSK